MLADRFWASVDKNGPVPPHRSELGPCWVWTGAVKDTGYGQTGSPVCGTRRAHIASFAMATGTVPVNCVLHKCDNRRCVRPDHLFEGTKRENTRDMMSKGRHGYGHVPGAKNGNAILAPAQALEIACTIGPLREMAEKHGVSVGLVCAIRKGRAWKQIEL